MAWEQADTLWEMLSYKATGSWFLSNEEIVQ